jgi:hypothetical protein
LEEDEKGPGGDYGRDVQRPFKPTGPLYVRLFQERSVKVFEHTFSWIALTDSNDSVRDVVGLDALRVDFSKAWA